jgi:phytoene synthase
MSALYAFLRVSDDLADANCSTTNRAAALTDWRCRFEAALAGQPSHPVHLALLDALNRYHVPPRYLRDALDGIAMDLEPCRYATFDELTTYCYRVASVVGLACVHVWGFTSDDALEPAISAGIAFQMTNILRDLREDAERGRVYLPREDLDRFGYDEERLRRGVRDPAFRDLMRFQVDRARRYYDASRALVPYLQASGRAVFLVMWRTYRGLLDAIERREYDVFSQRVRLSNWTKVRFALQALPIRFGLVTG